MTLHYQTLKAYAVPLMLSDKKHPMDIAISLVGVEFPPENNNVRFFLYLHFFSTSQHPC